MESDTKRDRLLAMKCFKASFLIAATFACFSLAPEKVEYYKLSLSTPEGQGKVSIFMIHDCDHHSNIKHILL